MKKNKLENLENTLETKLESAYSMIPINLIGQAFYGRGTVSKKDGSFTSTLWYVLFYLPLVPVETYRIMGYNQIEKRFMPRVFALDEYIPYERRKLDLDYVQIVTTLVGVWTMAAALVVLALAYPAIMFSLAGLTVAAIGVKKLEKRLHKNKPGVVVTEGKTQTEPAKNLKQPPPIPVPPMKSYANEIIVKPTDEVPLVLESPKKLNPTKSAQATPVSENHIEGLWDDMFQYKYVDMNKIKPHQSHFIEVLGYLNFMLFPVYFFIYVYLTDYPDQFGRYPLLRTAYNFLTTGHFISILSIVIGFIVMSKNRALGFFLLLFSIFVFFDLHVRLWVYLNAM
jgi:hypothetical protein